MEQIKYILYSVVILIGASLTYLVMKPIVETPWIASAAVATKARPEANEPVPVKNSVGKNLFSANCQTCHSLHKNLTGPALAGVEERGPWGKRENLVKWTRNPAAFIATTPYTRALVAQYNGQVMPSFSQLSQEEINGIFDYIKEASARP